MSQKYREERQAKARAKAHEQLIQFAKIYSKEQLKLMDMIDKGKYFDESSIMNYFTKEFMPLIKQMPADYKMPMSGYSPDHYTPDYGRALLDAVGYFKKKFTGDLVSSCSIHGTIPVPKAVALKQWYKDIIIVAREEKLFEPFSDKFIKERQAKTRAKVHKHLKQFAKIYPKEQLMLMDMIEKGKYFDQKSITKHFTKQFMPLIYQMSADYKNPTHSYFLERQALWDAVGYFKTKFTGVVEHSYSWYGTIFVPKAAELLPWYKDIIAVAREEKLFEPLLDKQLKKISENDSIIRLFVGGSY